jgi:hypothetical protein
MTNYNYGDVVYVTTIDEYGTIIEEAMAENNYLANVLLGDGTTMRADEEEMKFSNDGHYDYEDDDYDVEEDEEEEAPKGKVDKISALLQTYGKK